MEMETFCNEEPLEQEGTEQDYEPEQENGAQTDTTSPLEFSPKINLLEDRRTNESLTIEGEVHENREVSITKKGKYMFFIYFSFDNFYIYENMNY